MQITRCACRPCYLHAQQGDMRPRAARLNPAGSVKPSRRVNLKAHTEPHWVSQGRLHPGMQGQLTQSQQMHMGMNVQMTQEACGRSQAGCQPAVEIMVTKTDVGWQVDRDTMPCTAQQLAQAPLPDTGRCTSHKIAARASSLATPQH